MRKWCEFNTVMAACNNLNKMANRMIWLCKNKHCVGIFYITIMVVIFLIKISPFCMNAYTFAISYKLWFHHFIQILTRSPPYHFFQITPSCTNSLDLVIWYKFKHFLSVSYELRFLHLVWILSISLSRMTSNDIVICKNPLFFAISNKFLNFHHLMNFSDLGILN